MRVSSALATLRSALDRPLTAYYLLLGASALLLTIGLIMVLSASSVYSYEKNGSSYAVVERQLVWVLIGIPCAWIASRLPHRSEEHTSELQSLMRISYAGFCLKNKTPQHHSPIS